jgi:hypothetical protein
MNYIYRNSVTRGKRMNVDNSWRKKEFYSLYYTSMAFKMFLSIKKKLERIVFFILNFDFSGSKPRFYTGI